MGAIADMGQAGGEVLGAIVGEIWASGDRRRAEELYDKALRQIENLGLPPIDKLRIKAELQQAVELGPSAFEEVRVDPALEAAQRTNMDSLQRTADAQGMDAQAIAAQRQAQTEAGRATAARMGSIRQGMAARGVRGSGLELLANMQAAQAETGANADAGFSASSAAAQRAMQARLAASGLAGEISDRSFNQQGTKANARDAVSRFNAQTTNDVNRFNAGQRTQANVFNANAWADQWNREVQLAAMKNAARQGRAVQYEGKANRKSQMATQIGGTTGRAIGTGIEMYYTGGMSGMADSFGGGGGGGGGGMI